MPKDCSHPDDAADKQPNPVIAKEAAEVQLDNPRTAGDADQSINHSIYNSALHDSRPRPTKFQAPSDEG